jgi:hypothetical protein
LLGIHTIWCFHRFSFVDSRSLNPRTFAIPIVHLRHDGGCHHGAEGSAATDMPYGRVAGPARDQLTRKLC